LKKARKRAAQGGQEASFHGEREGVLALVREAADILKTRFGARRVILFGSLLRTAWFSTHSDVDLAVEGLTGDSYWEAWRVVEGIITDRPVDLIDMETAGESLLDALDRCGIEL
jgi:predicted nucleotidyltransferase